MFLRLLAKVNRRVILDILNESGNMPVVII